MEKNFVTISGVYTGVLTLEICIRYNLKAEIFLKGNIFQLKISEI